MPLAAMHITIHASLSRGGYRDALTRRRASSYITYIAAAAAQISDYFRRIRQEIELLQARAKPAMPPPQLISPKR